jgi:hypothetical protein
MVRLFTSWVSDRTDAGYWMLDAGYKKLLRVARCKLQVKPNKRPGHNTVIPVKTDIQPTFLISLF